MDEQGTDYDRILGQTAGLLAERGDEKRSRSWSTCSPCRYTTPEVIGTRKIFHTYLTGDDGPLTETFYRREAVLDVAEHLVPEFTDDVCGRIAATLSYVAERNGEENVATSGRDPRYRRCAGTGVKRMQPGGLAASSATRRAANPPSPPTQSRMD
jgi:hypothetical protein